MKDLQDNIAFGRTNFAYPFYSNSTTIIHDLNIKSISNNFLQNGLNSLAELVAEVTNSYSSVIFWAKPDKTLQIAAFHTQSEEFIPTAQIKFGTSLVGWVAENKTKLLVSPFEHSARSLLYYSDDQELKSFLAIPILDAAQNLLGVLVCDSQNVASYTQNTEKILGGVIQQILNLHLADAALALNTPQKQSDPDVLTKFIESLRLQITEEGLFNLASRIPKEIADYAALVVVSSAERGVGVGNFYSTSKDEQLKHRLLETICRHKRVLCSEKNVRILSQNDAVEQKAFLSIPFRVLEKEAGSLNFTTAPGVEFSDNEINSLETLAKVIGQTLENIRLKERLIGHNLWTTLSWKIFFAQANLLLQQRTKTKEELGLMRIEFSNLESLERNFSILSTLELLERATRLAEQVKRQNSAICRIYESKLYILTPAEEVPSFANRFCKMIEKLYLTDRTSGITKQQCEMLLNSVSILSAIAPNDGVTLEELISKIHNLSNELTAYKKRGIS
ncbi:MAG: GAF domain-containing protein [Deltaproteobacteria bacterium]|jgi:GAF domain-containing protein|nr:GAF domain-containing protein [Deltaproteobacteria bacterium]